MNNINKLLCMLFLSSFIFSSNDKAQEQALLNSKINSHIMLVNSNKESEEEVLVHFQLFFESLSEEDKSYTLLYRSKVGVCPLLHAAVHNLRPRVVDFLLSQGAHAGSIVLSSSNVEHASALGFLLFENDDSLNLKASQHPQLVSIAEKCFNYGCFFEERDPRNSFGRTLLMEAARKGNALLVNLLLSRGANVFNQFCQSKIVIGRSPILQIRDVIESTLDEYMFPSRATSCSLNKEGIVPCLLLLSQACNDEGYSKIVNILKKDYKLNAQRPFLEKCLRDPEKYYFNNCSHYTLENQYFGDVVKKILDQHKTLRPARDNSCSIS